MPRNPLNLPRSLSAIGTITLAGLLGSCSAIESIVNIGEPPKLNAIDNPTSQPGYKPVQMPMPAAQPATYNPNSLWRNGSRAFFKDQRAHEIGDILTITVNINDSAVLNNETQRARTNTTDTGITNFFGVANLPLTNQQLPARTLTSDGTTSFTGNGSINRSEALVTNIAAVVTQVLPNGNLVVEGKQEIRVNFEMRQLIVGGIVRPEDIQSDNTIDSSKIAEERLSYGGKGQITQVQQPPWGQQFFDIVLPF
jgi:flagellar L-ring protein FlgH